MCKLKHDVYFLEDSNDYPSCYDPSRFETGTDPTYGLRFASLVLGRIGLGDRWAYYDAHTNRWLGPLGDKAITLCGSADLLINLAGVNPIRPWLRDIPRKVFVDQDPAFTQIRNILDEKRRRLSNQHTSHYTFGENAGKDGCGIPDDGIDWKPTRQPVVLDMVQAAPGNTSGKFTTVMLWNSYPSLEYQGKKFGMKSDSFSPYFDIPIRVAEEFEIAVGGGRPPIDKLRTNGWSIVDPHEPTKNPWSYEKYIRNSKGEFSVAKHGYVISNSGWFSERSACYLANGRPVVLQNTGFSDWMETGSGVLPFDNPDEAVSALEEISGDYASHCKAARQVAEQYFDSQKILRGLIEGALSERS
ncbi:glycosyltransferase [Pseudomonadota bacterium]